MRTFFIIPWYRSGDYEAAASQFGDLPGSYRAWRERALSWEKQCQDGALPCLRVVVRPDEFRAWCRTRHLQPDAEARSTFIIERARPMLWPDVPA